MRPICGVILLFDYVAVHVSINDSNVNMPMLNFFCKCMFTSLTCAVAVNTERHMHTHIHMHTQTHTHIHMHTDAHTHTHTHTHTKNIHVAHTQYTYIHIESCEHSSSQFHSKKKLVCMVIVLHLETSRVAIGHIYTQSFQSRPLSLFTTTQ